jgi:hypothetical protein
MRASISATLRSIRMTLTGACRRTTLPVRGSQTTLCLQPGQARRRGKSASPFGDPALIPSIDLDRVPKPGLQYALKDFATGAPSG